ncbi:transglutaminase family protein [Sphingomonas sp. KRR8]|uniref:transglutaminase family protein n=1 Tax=Sphingomonas sp. KRR8 TaxID=2942996 RepID=UPI0020220446|nr:transglutaminase family protein [Sphingomonas sp. KRR8]URD60478.1 transglutaminase family protein [Sphingomonas sp. KRR8]
MRVLALEAIEEAAAASYKGPVKRGPGLALALAWLLHFGRPGQQLPRWPFESFWRELDCEKDHDRSAGVTAAANAIYLALGQRRG